MAGKKADKLRLNEPLYTKDIKVNQRSTGFHSIVHLSLNYLDSWNRYSTRNRPASP